MTLIQRLRHLFLTFLDGNYCLLQLSGANTQPSVRPIASQSAGPGVSELLVDSCVCVG